MQKVLKKLTVFIVAAISVFFTFSAYAKDKVYNADVVVVGVGGAGVSAAVSAAEHGAKVIAIEKQDIAGGSSNFAEGLFAVQTQEQRNQFVTLTADEAFNRSMEINQGYRVNPALVMKYIKESTNTISWLKNEGVQFKVFRMSAEEPQVWHLVQDYKGAHHGAALITRMLERADELGVKILYGTPGKSIVVKDGKVRGVIAEDDRGNRVVINAKAVVIATGGFPDSKQKIAEWTPFNPDQVQALIPLGKTGDGIQMMKDVKADTVGLGLMLCPGIEDKFLPPMGNSLGMTWEPNLWVNKYGDRFINEQISHNFALAGNAIEAQRDAYIWTVFDENTVKYLETYGSRAGLGVLIPVGTKFTALRKEILDAQAKGSTKVAAADNLDDLAKQMGVDPAKLKASVRQYNDIAFKHVDDEFGRDPDTVIPLTQPKYYALKVTPYFFTTIGGARVNTNFEVTDDHDQPIKGLYAAGCDAGGQYGRTYTLWASGSAYSFAATSGRLSGANAAQFVKDNN